MSIQQWQKRFLGTVAAAFMLTAIPAAAQVNVQCPGDVNGDAVIDIPDPAHPNAKCMHLAAGDGYVRMADGKDQYIFGFTNMTGVPASQVMPRSLLDANFAAPTIRLDQGDEFYLSLTNAGMLIRPDLFDPHTVHYHGFPNSSTVFDGLPDTGLSIGMGATLTYYYKNVEPGTYMYHCHVEAAEHMQMGMLGSLYVRAAQDKTTPGQPVCSGSPFLHQAGLRYAYNDCDGSTRYNVDYALQIGSFDSHFHDLHEAVQPLPFATMRDDYPMLNGRGYPDTVNPSPLSPPQSKIDSIGAGAASSQKEGSLVTAAPNQRILLRISNLNVTRLYTLQSLGITMEVVGKDAKLHRGPDGKNLYYRTNSVTLGGGESVDVILDTAGVASGSTYFLYASELNYLANHDEAASNGMGGMLTEIRVN